MELRIRTQETKVKSFWVLNLKDFLESKNKTQADMAKKFKVSQTYISDIAHCKKALQTKMKDWLESL